MLKFRPKLTKFEKCEFDLEFYFNPSSLRERESKIQSNQNLKRILKQALPLVSVLDTIKQPSFKCFHDKI